MPASPQSAIRLIALDMDGTLLNHEGRVSPRNLAALHAAHDAGVEVVIATGRRHCFAMHVLRPLGLHHANALVSSNGTVTRTLGSASEPSELLARTHLPTATARWLCSHLDEFRNALVLTFDRVGPDGEDSRGALVVEHLEDLHTSIGKWMQSNGPYIVRVNPIELALAPIHSESPTEPHPDAPIQAMLCGTIDRMARAEALLRAHPDTAASLTLHRTEYPGRNLSILDILPTGCSKGAALLSLAAIRNIQPSRILAIGDNWNDVSMLEIAGHSVLMANAPEDLKANALTRGWAIGPSNNSDGVAEAIESALAVAEVVG